MTNDKTTLNGALQELGETMADNLTTMGVPSTYDEGLTTLASKILQIGPTPPTPTPASIDLTGTKSILSYADSEQCVLTATVLDENDTPVEGVDVNLYNGSTLWDTLTTDSSGECSKTYSSAGSGDITFTAEVDGTLLTKTYAIEDCTYYNSGTITGSQTLNIPNLPVNFKATYKIKRTANNDALSWLNVGNDANNCFFFGQIGTDAIGIFKRVNGTNASLNHQYSVVQTNIEYPLEFTYNNGSLTLVGCGTTLTASYTETNRGFVSTNVGANNYMKELKIKPL